MTHSELELLQTDEVRTLIEQNIERDPNKIALDKRIPHAGLVATQVKYLQRARRKLPDYYEARAIIPAIAYEQSSSLQSASTKLESGALCIDLTCGLGVDSLALSKQFERVISVEIDPIRAEVARVNFARLGATNIEVVCASAEEFVASFEGKADLVYADPDRREQGKRLVHPEECSPNVVALLPRLREIAKRLMFKNSPLFDTEEAFHIFGEECRVEAVSVAGECKEVVVTLGEGIAEPEIVARAVGIGDFALRRATRGTASPDSSRSIEWRWLLVPDVALRKARIATDYCRTFEGVEIFGNESYAFAESAPEGFIGKCWEIDSIHPYKPKELQKKIGKKIEILRQNFPYSTAEICRSLKVKEGGSERWAMTTAAGSEWAIKLK
ncbi:MAG: SAM-dependent methyltransferase [Tidjanibacter sp.]|nr:SAM-dependent methyltransferase [Tidjanibacter sp.]